MNSDYFSPTIILKENQSSFLQVIFLKNFDLFFSTVVYSIILLTCASRKKIVKLFS